MTKGRLPDTKSEPVPAQYFSTFPTAPRRARATRMRMDLGCFRHASPIFEIALLDGAHPGYGKQLVSPPVVNSRMVNGSALYLFPLTLYLTSILFLSNTFPPRHCPGGKVFYSIVAREQLSFAYDLPLNRTKCWIFLIKCAR